MPLDRYFNKPGNSKPGEGSTVMQRMQARYGAEKGKRVFYATVNRMKKGSPAERAAQSSAPKARDSTSQAAAKRLRKKAMSQGNKQRAEVGARHPFRNEPNAGPPIAQPGQYEYGGK